AKHIVHKTPVQHYAYGSLMGSIAAVTGVGGGALVNPYMLWSGHDMHIAVGTSAAAVVVISSFASITYIFTGHDVSIAQAHIGYVIWPAVIAVALFSMLCAPLGARLAMRVPKEHLKKVLALILLVVSLKFIF
ncbi:MAG: sulfite exporter TauE/SafE family protein, partial [Gammaproteobacteria bacterium]|nr:sulfite exporter TauE/SafE family protein [Gammaproteobacteria bacterium]